MKKIIPILFLISVFIFSCSIPLAKPPSFELNGGSLAMFIGNDPSIRTIVPALDLDITEYVITGTGPNGETFTDTVPVVDPDITTVYTQLDLITGAWSVLVDAYNATPELIATATELFLILDDQTTTVPVTVLPLSGSGNLNLTINYPSASVNGITATLTPVSGSPAPMDFTPIGATSSSYSGVDLATGYYELYIELLEGTNVLRRIRDVVRIMDQQDTDFTWTFTVDNLISYGDASIEIDSDMQTPLDITFGGVVDPLTQGTDMIVTVTLSPTVTGETYKWYRDGIELTGETSSSLTIGSTLGLGDHYLDVIVTYGTILSSNSVSFTVTAP